MRAPALLLICLAPLALGGCDGSVDPLGLFPEPTRVEAAPLELTGRVVDAADLIPDLIEADLTAQLETLERDTKAQFVVVTTPGLQGMTIADFGLKLSRGWGLGDKDRNDGLLLIVAPNERKVRIEVGYGLEKPLPDDRCAEFIQMILPSFRQGDYVAGIETVVDLLDRELRTKLETTT